METLFEILFFFKKRIEQSFLIGKTKGGDSHKSLPLAGAWWPGAGAGHWLLNPLAEAAEVPC
jgi:hypothetical protein